jgi:hypothetical protein
MLAFLLAIALTSTAPNPVMAAPPSSGDLTGVIRDSTSGQPLAGGELIVFHGGQVVARSETDAL